MDRFPEDFSKLLSARGRRVLQGREPKLCGALEGAAFVSSGGLFDAAKVRAIPKLLERGFAKRLTVMHRELPQSTGAVATGGEYLPKTGRVMSTPHDGSEDAALGGDETGLEAMLRSSAYHDFVQALCGRTVSGPRAMQVLCYRPGDYAGPHTDHHPEDPMARHGYTDVHLTFCTPGVKRQLLVYERAGHLTEVAPLTQSGMVTAYRLPFWHYTTPLEGSASSRRWLILGSFVDAS